MELPVALVWCQKMMMREHFLACASAALVWKVPAKSPVLPLFLDVEDCCTYIRESAARCLEHMSAIKLHTDKDNLKDATISEIFKTVGIPS